MVSIGKALQLAITGKALNPVSDNRGWHTLIRESVPGTWQRNVSVDRESVLAFPAVFACQTLIASDIAKLRIKLVRNDQHGIWTETTNSELSPLLRKPNHFQTRNQFIENWVLSRLSRGNTYVLKHRDNRGIITKLYVLDPTRCRPLVADNGEVYYELSCDRLTGLAQDTIIAPASEIIHDRWNCLFHPLVGLSPIYACGLAATQGLAIQNNSAAFFQNASQPGGVLTAPGSIDQTNADRLKEYWDNNFTGSNSGKVAVLGDGLKFEKMTLTAEEAQLIEQLKWTAEVVCSVFHVPAHMVGMGPVPALGNVESLQTAYYSQAVQSAIEAMESCLDDGLDMAADMGVEFDLSGLLRMDTATQIKALAEAVGGSIMSPNEARARLDLPPVEGGQSPMAQQQDFSLAALAERDRNKPFATPAPPSPAGGGEDTKALLSRVTRLLDEIEFASPRGEA